MKRTTWRPKLKCCHYFFFILTSDDFLRDVLNVHILTGVSFKFSQLYRKNQVCAFAHFVYLCYQIRSNSNHSGLNLKLSFYRLSV